MTKLKSLQDIKETAVRLQETLMGSDIETIKPAEKAFHQLVDRFYRENEDMMAPLQCEAAKKDFEYFMRLVDLAIAYYRREEVERGMALWEDMRFHHGLISLTLISPAVTLTLS